MINIETFRLVGKCLGLDENPEFRDELIEKSNLGLIDWERFVFICSNHLILPTVYLKFQTNGILDHIPEELTLHLKEMYQLNLSRNSEIEKQLKEIVESLNKNGIMPILLKGAANLMDGLYRDKGERMMSDIDLLVEEEDYVKSAEILRNIGYMVAEEASEWVDIHKAKHYPRLFRKDCVADVEIHRIPVDRSYIGWFNSEIINQEKGEISSLLGCFVESDLHKIIHNFIHCQLVDEGFLTGIVSLRDVYDLYLLSKRCPLERAIPSIKPKQKAIAYFAYVGMMLGLNKSFYSKRNLSYRVLMSRHFLIQRSKFSQKTYLSSVFILQRIFKGYLGQIFKAFYSKEKRQYLTKRITNKDWYSNHLRMYSRFYKRNIKG
ncbi:nucleotidyltransferase family protein [Sunxiuqinia sp. A32]|uniref:nucleotidyltransferase family protein n=1 Tax=Sunxiuqinia sp. A32 TaxID=3461496 RepID=UPI00404647D2